MLTPVVVILVDTVFNNLITAFSFTSIVKDIYIVVCITILGSLSIIIAKSMNQTIVNAITYVLLLQMLAEVHIIKWDILYLVYYIAPPLTIVFIKLLVLVITGYLREEYESITSLIRELHIERILSSSTQFVLENVSLIIIIIYVAYKLTLTPLFGSEVYFIGVCISILLSIIIAQINNYMVILVPFSWLSIPLMLSYVLDIKMEFIAKGGKEGILIGRTKALLTMKRGKTWNQIPQISESGKKQLWKWITCPQKPYHYNLGTCENPHILICGATGTGKSTLASIILKELHTHLKVNFLVLDHHGEYEKLLEQIGLRANIINPLNYSINLLELDGLSPRAKSIELADMLQRIFRLGPLQKMLLEELFEEAYNLYNIFEEDPTTWNNQPPKLHDVLKIIRMRKEASIDKSEILKLNSIEPYIRQLAYSIFTETTIPLDYIITNNTVIDLSKIPSETSRCIYAEALLRKIYYKISRSNIQETKYFIVVDEAHRLTRRGGHEPSLLARLVMESRKYGIGFIIITQQPKDLDPSIIGNVSTIISFKLSEPENVEYISKAISGYSEHKRIEAIKKALYYMPPYHVIFKGCDEPEPYIIEIYSEF